MARENGLTHDAARAAARSVEVALVDPSGALTTLSYAVPDHLSSAIAPGAAVAAPLGARQVTGIVVGPSSAPPAVRLKPLARVLPELSVPRELLELVLWAARYYRVPLGSLLRALVPPPVRRLRRRHVRPTAAALPVDAPARDLPLGDLLGDTAGSEAVAAALPDRILARLPAAGLDLKQLVEEMGPGTTAALRVLRRRGLVVLEDVEVERRPLRRAFRAAETGEPEPEFPRAPRQAAVHAYVRARAPHAVLLAELEARIPGAARVLPALVRRGLIVDASDEQPDGAAASSAAGGAASATPAGARALRPAQADAVTRICDAAGRFAPFLLFGVTGSGKTEVYLRAAEEARARGDGVLVLVPEIGLTPQLVAEARRRFPGATAVLHSALPAPERWQTWRDVAAGRTPVVIGARSAVFAPLPRLGLIVVDEEHDAAYKQEEAPRYHARDLAVMRAKLAGCPVVLASATPSLESYHAATQGRYEMLRLPARVNDAPLPAVEVIDLRTALPRPDDARGERTGGRRGRRSGETDASPLAPPLAAALVETYRAGDQSVLFLNRRGYARFIQCDACGHVETCPSCSVSLTVHRAQRIAACHHCGFTRRPATHCPGCGTVLEARGFGTEQIEAHARALLPAARIARLDRDTTTSPAFLRATVDAWRHGELDVLVGTQMVAKGHDAPGVTLIGVVLADASLHFPDFRSAERTFQLLAQVAGRAGRGAKPGRVLVQTRQPQHPSLVAATQHDYAAFARAELRSRSELGYPPFGRLVRVVVEGGQAEAQRCAATLAERIAQVAGGMPEAGRPQVLGPAPAPLERLRGRYRVQLLVKAADHRTIARLLDGAALDRAARGGAALRLVVDVDPVSML
jgi:primosomal protein N' (replication factor Y)